MYSYSRDEIEMYHAVAVILPGSGMIHGREACEKRDAMTQEKKPMRCGFITAAGVGGR